MAFPTVLVSDVAGSTLSTLPPGATIRFAPSKDVTLAAWGDIGRLTEAAAWPKEPEERQTTYETLLAGNAGFPDRVSAIRAAFSQISGGGCEGATGEEGGDATWDAGTAAATTSIKL